MNEFTKDELHLLASLVFVRWLNSLTDPLLRSKIELFKNLQTKIESMIEKYCEHQESEANHNYEVMRCKKCGKIFV